MRHYCLPPGQPPASVRPHHGPAFLGADASLTSDHLAPHLWRKKKGPPQTLIAQLRPLSNCRRHTQSPPSTGPHTHNLASSLTQNGRPPVWRPSRACLEPLPLLSARPARSRRRPDPQEVAQGRNLSCKPRLAAEQNWSPLRPLSGLSRGQPPAKQRLIRAAKMLRRASQAQSWLDLASRRQVCARLPLQRPTWSSGRRRELGA